jgi:hypothetical protein
VDCIAEESLYWRNDIKGYPTLLAFLAGEPLLYDGPRDAASIATFMRHLQAPVLESLQGAAALRSFTLRHRASATPAVLVFGGEGGRGAEEEGEGEGAERVLDLVCKQLEGCACAVVRGGHGAAAARDMGVLALPGFALLPAVPAEEEEEGGRQAAVVMDASTGESVRQHVGLLGNESVWTVHCFRLTSSSSSPACMHMHIISLSLSLCLSLCLSLFLSLSVSLSLSLSVCLSLQASPLFQSCAPGCCSTPTPQWCSSASATWS